MLMSLGHDNDVSARPDRPDATLQPGRSGLADTNVYPAHTLRLSSALLAAGRPHEVLLLPGAGHQALSEEIAEKLLWHQVRFLQRHLRVDPETCLA
jgi:fermentation-respiration switch protein FrsA (DUF1100 family)